MIDCLQTNAIKILTHEKDYLHVRMPLKSSEIKVHVERSSKLDIVLSRAEQFYHGTNVVLTGDSAANGSPIGGLGLSLVTSVYTDAIEQLVTDIYALNKERESALQAYDKRLEEIAHFRHFSLKK